MAQSYCHTRWFNLPHADRLFPAGSPETSQKRRSGRLLLQNPVSVLASVELAFLGVTGRVAAGWPVRILLNWRVLACEGVCGRGTQSGLKGRCSTTELRH